MVRPARLSSPVSTAVGGAHDSWNAYHHADIGVHERDAVEKMVQSGSLFHPGGAAVGSAQNGKATDGSPDVGVHKRYSRQGVTRTWLEHPRLAAVVRAQDGPAPPDGCRRLTIHHADAEKRLVRPARLGRPGLAAVGGAQDSSGVAYGDCGVRVDEGDAPEMNERAAGPPRPRLATVRGVQNRSAAAHRGSEGSSRGPPP